MQTAQHLAAAQQFLNDAAALEVSGSSMAASEMIWGAVVQSLEAIGHIQAGNERGSLSSRRRSNLAEITTPDGLTKYYRVQNNLHGHFYKGHLSPEAFSRSMQEGRDYAAELLAMALSSEAGEA